jgi:hypothetical protein
MASFPRVRRVEWRIFCDLWKRKSCYKKNISPPSHRLLFSFILSAVLCILSLSAWRPR